MNARVLKPFPHLTKCTPLALVRAEQDMLAILCTHCLEGAPAPRTSLLSLTLLNLQTQATEAVILYNGTVPDCSNSTTDALLAYDPPFRRWIIAQLQGEWYVGVRTLTKQSGANALEEPVW